MPDLSSSPEGRALAQRLAEAHRRLVAVDLPDPAGARLYRQFIAVCDAVKVAGADTDVVERRLAAFLAALERAVGRINGYGSRPDNS
jgi:NAD(P)-dependent dehydrogenase (short-subunit alcohol dehydrogenase family)